MEGVGTANILSADAARLHYVFCAVASLQRRLEDDRSLIRSASSSRCASSSQAVRPRPLSRAELERAGLSPTDPRLPGYGLSTSPKAVPGMPRSQSWAQFMPEHGADEPDNLPPLVGSSLARPRPATVSHDAQGAGPSPFWRQLEVATGAVASAQVSPESWPRSPLPSNAPAGLGWTEGLAGLGFETIQ